VTVEGAQINCIDGPAGWATDPQKTVPRGYGGADSWRPTWRSGRATDVQVLEDAKRLIAAWNERQAKRMPIRFSYSTLTVQFGEKVYSKSAPSSHCGIKFVFLVMTNT
jgi:hypothetical protein